MNFGLVGVRISDGSSSKVLRRDLRRHQIVTAGPNMALSSTGSTSWGGFRVHFRGAVNISVFSVFHDEGWSLGWLDWGATLTNRLMGEWFEV